MINMNFKAVCITQLMDIIPSEVNINMWQNFKHCNQHTMFAQCLYFGYLLLKTMNYILNIEWCETYQKINNWELCPTHVKVYSLKIKAK